MKRIFLILFAVLLLSSCDEAVTENQDTTLPTATAPETTDEVSTTSDKSSTDSEPAAESITTTDLVTTNETEKTSETKENALTITYQNLADLNYETYTADKSINQGLSSDNTRSNIEANEENVSLWVNTNNALALSHIANSPFDENYITSSYSQQSSLVTMYLGAQENSATQIVKTLGLEATSLENDRTLLLSAYNTLDKQLMNSDLSGNTAFSASTNLWGNQYYPFAQDFSDQAVSYLGAKLHSVDFIEQPEVITSAINNTIDNESEQLITGVLASYNTGIETALVSSHTSNFNSAWRFPFTEDDNELGSFWLISDQENFDVPVMKTSLDTLYYNSGTESIIALPYENSDWALYLIESVDQGKHSQLIDSMDTDKLHSLMDNMSLSSINLSIPKLSLSSKYNLPDFESFMSTDLFNSWEADLSGLHGENINALLATSSSLIGAIDINSQGFHYSSAAQVVIAQKPKITGTGHFSLHTTASSFYTLPGTSEVYDIDINGPFLFILYHTPSNMILSAGNVVDPR